MISRQYGANYRFGFNGQEKDDEIAGKGNFNTAEFWEYDSRLGRRWNLDPVEDVGVSPYACFRNDPIHLSDPNGDCADEGGCKGRFENKHLDRNKPQGSALPKEEEKLVQYYEVKKEKGYY